MRDLPPLPELPALPALKQVSNLALRMPMMSGKDKMGLASRVSEAEQLANEMRVAYGITRMQNEANKKRARAKGRAAQRIAERR